MKFFKEHKEDLFLTPNDNIKDCTFFTCCCDPDGKLYFKDIDQYYSLNDLSDVKPSSRSGHLIYNGREWTSSQPSKQNEILFNGSSGILDSSPNLIIEDNELKVDGSLICNETSIHNNKIKTNALHLKFTPVHQDSITDSVKLHAYQGLIISEINRFNQDNLYTFTVFCNKAFEGKSSIFLYISTKKLVSYVSEIVNGSFKINLYNMFPTFDEAIHIYFRVT